MKRDRFRRCNVRGGQKHDYGKREGVWKTHFSVVVRQMCKKNG